MGLSNGSYGWRLHSGLVVHELIGSLATCRCVVSEVPIDSPTDGPALAFDAAFIGPRASLRATGDSVGLPLLGSPLDPESQWLPIPTINSKSLGGALSTSSGLVNWAM